MGRTGTTSTIPRALFLCKKASTCRSKLSNKQNHYTVSFHLPLCGSFCTNGAATTSKQSANFRQSGLVAIYLGKYSVFLQKGLLTSHWSCSSSPAFKWLWKSSCQNKHKVFFWLLLKDRLSTRNLLRRKTMVLDSYECELCNSRQEETLEHLFLRCPYAIACWNLINLYVSRPSSFNFRGN